MKATLYLLFVTILAAMLWITVTASLSENIMTAGPRLWPDKWFQATLIDAYCGFATFFAWVAYKETGWLRRCAWFVAIVLLGNIAMAIYALIQLRKATPFSAESFLLRQKASENLPYQ